MKKIDRVTLTGIAIFLFIAISTGVKGYLIDRLFEQDTTAALARYGAFVGWIHDLEIAPFWILCSAGSILLIGITVFIKYKFRNYY